MYLSRALLVGLTFISSILPAAPAVATDIVIFAIKVSLPVNVVVGGQIVQRTLKENDIVNLALGRPLGTKVDKNTEVLAAAVGAYEIVGQVIVANPTQNGLAQVTTVVAEPTSLDVEKAYLNSGRQGLGTATGTVVATTLGNPALNALLTSTLWGGAGGKGKGFESGSASVKGSIAGRLSFRVTENGQTTTFAGFIVNGKGKVSGKPLGFYDDGTL